MANWAVTPIRSSNSRTASSPASLVKGVVETSNSMGRDGKNSWVTLGSIPSRRHTASPQVQVTPLTSWLTSWTVPSGFVSRNALIPPKSAGLGVGAPCVTVHEASTSTATSAATMRVTVARDTRDRGGRGRQLTARG